VTFSGAQPPERLNLARYCLSGKPSEKTALVVAGVETQLWSYAALEDVVLRLAEGLRRDGLEPGARLFIRMGNSLDYALMFFAANAIGAVPVAASPMLTPHEVAAPPGPPPPSHGSALDHSALDHSAAAIAQAAVMGFAAADGKDPNRRRQRQAFGKVEPLLPPAPLPARPPGSAPGRSPRWLPTNCPGRSASARRPSW
jgi:acyl-CoA synthetase (AMP-forming)/AMP-acid ligase II